MKRIIVNVDGLTIEEKQRVNEALAKVKNVRMINPLYWDAVVLLYGPSSDGVNVGFGYYEAVKTTHTPQQVLAMAGMAPAAEQDVFLADTLIISDSSGNIIYDSTLGALNPLIKKRANPGKGVSVKLDKNGVAVMVEKRKVRKDFDPAKEYSVNVADCTEEEKKEVQQAFFDAGFKWISRTTTYGHLDAVQYSNAYSEGGVTTFLMYGDITEDCNMTAKEFLELVYEPEQVGHAHAELMAQYAEDAKTHAEPWKLWEFRTDGDWLDSYHHPYWCATTEFRRKPKTHTVNGVEIPDLRVSPELGDKYYLADPTASKLADLHTFVMGMERLWAERGLCYQNTEEGRRAATLHAKAMLGMVQE